MGAQELARPDVFWYEAGLPQTIPGNPLIGESGNVNLGGLLAWEFLLMHWVEVRRWQDYKNFASVNDTQFLKIIKFLILRWVILVVYGLIPWVYLKVTSKIFK